MLHPHQVPGSEFVMSFVSPGMVVLLGFYLLFDRNSFQIFGEGVGRIDLSLYRLCMQKIVLVLTVLFALHSTAASDGDKPGDGPSRPGHVTAGWTHTSQTSEVREITFGSILTGIKEKLFGKKKHADAKQAGGASGGNPPRNPIRPRPASSTDSYPYYPGHPLYAGTLIGQPDGYVGSDERGLFAGANPEQATVITHDETGKSQNADGDNCTPADADREDSTSGGSQACEPTQGAESDLSSLPEPTYSPEPESYSSGSNDSYDGGDSSPSERAIADDEVLAMNSQGEFAIVPVATMTLVLGELSASELSNWMSTETVLKTAAAGVGIATVVWLAIKYSVGLEVTAFAAGMGLTAAQSADLCSAYTDFANFTARNLEEQMFAMHNCPQLAGRVLENVEALRLQKQN